MQHPPGRPPTRRSCRFVGDTLSARLPLWRFTAGGRDAEVDPGSSASLGNSDWRNKAHSISPKTIKQNEIRRFCVEVRKESKDYKGGVYSTERNGMMD